VSLSSRLSEGTLAVSNPREVALITAAHAVNEFYSVALPPILPLLVDDFAISYGEAGALVTVFFITYSLFQIPAGYLADRVGQRWLLGVGMLVLAAGMVLAAGARSYGMLVVAEVVAGIGGSTYHPAGLSLISDLETGQTEGKAMGIHGIGGVVGTALAPVVVGGVASLFDWRLALVFAAAVGLGYGLVFLALFRDVETGETGTAADGGTDVSEETLGAADTRTTGAETEGDDPNRNGDGDGNGNGTGTATATAPAPAPATAGGTAPADGDRGLRARLHTLTTIPLEPWVGVLIVVNFFVSTEIGAVRTFVPSYLVELAGSTTVAANAGLFVLLFGAGISSLGAGYLADRFDRPLLGVTAMVASAVVLAGTAVLPQVELLLFAWFFLLGTVMYWALPTMNAIVSQYSETEFSGSLFAVMLTAASLGSAAGPVLFGAVAERFGMRAAFPVVAAVAAVGAGGFVLLYRLGQ